MELQRIVNGSILIETPVLNETEEVYVDLSKLDFDKLKAAFAKTAKKEHGCF